MGKTKNNQQKIINKKREGFGPVSAVLVTLAIFFGSQLFVAILLGAYLAVIFGPAEVGRLFEESIFVQFGLILLIEAISLWLLWQFMSYRKIKLSEIGIKKPSVENILYAVPAYVVYLVVLLVIFALVQNFSGINTEQEQQIGFKDASGVLPLTLVFISLVILPAIVEEIMIRGFLYSGLVKKYSKKIAAVIASLIFAVAHLQLLGSGQPPLWIAAIDTFILSMVLIYLREITGNIWAGVTVHMIKNSLAFISLFIVHLI